MISDQEFAALEERMHYRMSVSKELDTCLAEIRALQKRRCRLEAQLRQMRREAVDRQEEVHAA